MAKSPEEMKAAMIAGLPEKTGKSLEQWLVILRSSKLSRHKEFMSLLKTQHGLTHGYANMIALQALESDSHTASDTDALVDGQYAGAKAALRPIYEAILTAVKKFGPDVDVSPKKAYVSLRRGKQFAIVQPSTATRVDVGINLKDVDPAGRLEASGSFNAMISHRVRVSTLAQVDAELAGWLKKAYDES
jgi:predicted transport protein